MGKGWKQAERDVAEFLSKWWRPIAPGCKFRRTPGSGGWGGREDVDVRSHFKACGDLMTTAETFPFTVEVKYREAWAMKNVLAGKPCPVWEWWRQCQGDAKDQGAEPMMWFRKKRQPWWVMLRFDFVSERTILPPHTAWAPSTLKGVDYGANVPVLFEAKKILDQNPLRFLHGKRVTIEAP